MLCFLVFIFDIRFQKYDMIIHEITELHVDELIPHLLGNAWTCTPIRFSPWHLGWPVRRPRKYTIIAKNTHQFAGTDSEFFALLSQRMAVSAAELWCAPESEVAEVFMELAIAKSMIPLPRSAKDFHKLLSLAQQRRLAQTCEMLVGTGLSEFVV